MHQRERAVSRRRAFSLVELLVALPLMALATAMALALLLRAAAATRTETSSLSVRRELRHAAILLHRELAPLEGIDLIAWNDTLLDVQAHLGVLVACRLNATDIDVAPPLPDSDEAWIAAIRAGDEITTWVHTDMRSPSGSPVAVRRTVTGAPAMLADGPCGPTTASTAMAATTPATRSRRWRIPTSAGVSLPAAGAPLLVRRRIQYAHYRSGGHWWLGRRTRDALQWDVIQPVAGPLLSSARGGMQLRASRADGAITTQPESVATVHVTLRADRRQSSASLPSDSIVIEVALRASAWTRRRP
jgi:type II secretory pathway pseudopilin PulG